jgi:hypothetical protein
MVAVMVVAMVTATADLTHSDEFQIRYHCISSDEKTEIHAHDCDDSHIPCRRLGADDYHSLTVDTVPSISMIFIQSHNRNPNWSIHDPRHNVYRSC